MTVYGYRRVSSIGQASEEKTSLAEQEMKIRGVAMVHGMGDPIIYTDPGVSGSIVLADRPEGGKLWRALTKGDTLICAKLDRLFRNAADALATADALKDRGVSLILVNMGVDPVTDGGVAKVFFTILAGFAEFEKWQILERMADGKRAKKAKGGHVAGSAPYGYVIVGRGRTAMLEAVPAEQAIIAEVKRLNAAGFTSSRIVKSLTETGAVSRSGKPFIPVQIGRMMKSVTSPDVR